tara:strand:- start:1 stop:291 length:291 start_codon:yes stop_codon:yes gene_type:complete
MRSSKVHRRQATPEKHMYFHSLSETKCHWWAFGFLQRTTGQISTIFSELQMLKPGFSYEVKVVLIFFTLLPAVKPDEKYGFTESGRSVKSVRARIS